jgi:hypothetical protein
MTTTLGVVSLMRAFTAFTDTLGSGAGHIANISTCTYELHITMLFEKGE